MSTEKLSNATVVGNPQTHLVPAEQAISWLTEMADAKLEVEALAREATGPAIAPALAFYRALRSARYAASACTRVPFSVWANASAAAWPRFGGCLARVRFDPNLPMHDELYASLLPAFHLGDVRWIDGLGASAAGAWLGRLGGC